MAKIYFNKVAILGVGLIGASLALALKKNKLCNRITGYGRTVSNLQRAKAKKIIDAFETDIIKACADADLIVFSLPVGSFIDTAKKIRLSLKKGAIVTDVGSVKGKLVMEMEHLMPEGTCFVAGHPIAGSDKAGIESASANLFSGAKFILTPTKKTDKTAFKKIRELWKTLGVKMLVLSPDEHDLIYAAVSHLPHLIAYSIVNTVADVKASYIKFAGQGFKDTTRIASSSPELWRDICLMNSGNLLELIDIFKKNIDSIALYLKKSDLKSIEKEFKKAKALRDNVK